MPQIKFTDTAIAKLKADKTTWFSDPSVKGLRLCVTPGGVKTWYVVRWDATAQKTRQVKLGPWAAKGTHTVWAKNQIGKIVLDITDGRARTRSERAEERAGVPTLREAFERDLTTRTTRGAAYGGPIHNKTTQGYRATFDKYLSTWADLKVDALDHAAVQRLLDDLADRAPFAAHKLNLVVGFSLRRAERMINGRLPYLVPKLDRNPKMQKRAMAEDVTWKERWACIEQVENEHIRLCWMLRWHTGMRGAMLRGLTWSDVDLDAGTVVVRHGLKHAGTDKRVIALSDRAWAMVRRLSEIRFDDSDWVFPSRRIVGRERGPLDALDRLMIREGVHLNEGDLRHLWSEATQDVDTREMVLRWLCGQRLTDGDTQALGHYGKVPVERQRRVANAISRVIDIRCEASPSNVVEMGSKRA
ncbi:tyrosine-type recombinase/integrase [Roseinatronobacter sp. S2]|uniref:tyrosine-type recombinase/integrase n=1 Tax=Roseinatronobacter sp. S2 TaxID=3035471 RepID=UPI00240F1A2F|nr:tyrosine-type recombinase/integrase [Roseinatronobacter sp. S2]WFE74259.1 tyrosine-type recombinase/integrase [Roseinatronobacter sp. S2]